MPLLKIHPTPTMIKKSTSKAKSKAEPKPSEPVLISVTRDEFKVMELAKSRLLSKNTLSQRYERLFIHIPKPVKKFVSNVK